MAGVGRDPLVSAAKQWGGEGACRHHPHLSHLASLEGPLSSPANAARGRQSEFQCDFERDEGTGVEVEIGGGLNKDT